MVAYYKKQTREFRAAFSNGKNARIVALSIQKAYARAEKWAAQQEGNVKVTSIVDIIDDDK